MGRAFELEVIALRDQCIQQEIASYLEFYKEGLYTNIEDTTLQIAIDAHDKFREAVFAKDPNDFHLMRIYVDSQADEFLSPPARRKIQDLWMRAIASSKYP